MKQLFIISVIFLILPNATAQDLNKIIADPETGREILYGYCNREGLTSGTFNSWFEPEYESYEVKEKILSGIDRDLLYTCNITVVLGTWCSDSRREVPRFFKILDYLDFPKNNLKLICVDHTKDAANTKVPELSIVLVPTIIIYTGEVELGRIIESPVESLEADLAGILGH
jgi:hypothetical protein